MGKRKHPPANKQKNTTHNYIWFDGAKWISVLCNTNIPTDICTQFLFVNRSEPVLQQSSLQPQWRTVEKTARPWYCMMEYFFCQNNELIAIDIRVQGVLCNALYVLHLLGTLLRIYKPVYKWHLGLLTGTLSAKHFFSVLWSFLEVISA